MVYNQVKWSFSKAKFSQVVENAMKMGPQYVTRRGQESVVILSVTRISKNHHKKPTFKDFLLSCPKMDDGVEFERQKDYPRDVESGRLS